MNKFIKCTITGVALLFFLCLAACDSGDNEEKSTIKQFTDKTAEEAVQAIKGPLDSAKAVQGLANQKVEEINKAAEQAAD